MRKEYLLLAAIIVALGLYIVFKRTDGTHYELPGLSKLDSATVTKIELVRPEKSGGKIVFDRQNDTKWTVGSKGYPADIAKVGTILEAVTDLTLTALVSQSESYLRYELDPEHKMTAVAYDGDKVLRRFDVGKSAPTYQHTFVKLEKDPAVYHAKGDFKFNFNQELEQFRDMQAMLLDKTKVSQLTLKKGDVLMQFAKAAAQPPAKSETETEAETEEAKEAPAEPTWKNTTTNQPVAEDQIEAFLDEIKDLRCSAYIDTAAVDVKAYANTLFTVEVKDVKHHRLTLAFKKEIDPKDHVAESLDNAYPFKLSEFKLKDILKAADTLLRIETPEESDPPPADG